MYTNTLSLIRLNHNLPLTELDICNTDSACGEPACSTYSSVPLPGELFIVSHVPVDKVIVLCSGGMAIN